MLVSGAEFALEVLAGMQSESTPTKTRLGPMRRESEEAVDEISNPHLLLAHGTRHVTKLVLFPVRFMYTAVTGLVGTNDAAVAWYLAGADAQAKTLVEAAFGWRETLPQEESAAHELLREQLVPLYFEYIQDYIERLVAIGRPGLADSFRIWARLLQIH